MQGDQQRWDARHLAAHPDDDLRPSELLVRYQDRLPPGDALELACGRGRNALHLARHGWHVTAVDISPVALELARERAQLELLSIQWVQADLDALDLEPARWPLLVCTLFHSLKLLDAMIDALLPGGVLLYEALLYEPSSLSPEQPAPRFRVAPNALLLRILRAGLRILAYEEGRDMGHPTAAVLAQKPA